MNKAERFAVLPALVLGLTLAVALNHVLTRFTSLQPLPGAALAVGAVVMLCLGALAVLVALEVGSGIAAAAAPLDTAPVAYLEVARTYPAEGVIEAVRQSTVSAQTQGRIVELKVDVGDRVRRGDVIARIDPQEASQVVATAVA